MALPNFQAFFVPVLKVLDDGAAWPSGELRERVASLLRLTPEELQEKLPSGTQTVFTNRVAWSLVYLMKAGAIKRVRRAVFEITERGRALLEEHPEKLSVKDLNSFPEFVAFHKGDVTSNGKPEDKIAQTETPEEQLASAFSVLRDALAAEVLEAVRKSTPVFFENLVVDLLVAMGYGGSVADAGKAVGRSGDGGIDGTIKEDKLGLDVVYVQAKRWSGTVGRPVVQAFAGSLEGVRARKGILITASDFSQEAKDYVKRIEKKIILIDGEQLADFMIEHNVGVTPTQTIILKRLDSDYFENA